MGRRPQGGGAPPTRSLHVLPAPSFIHQAVRPLGCCAQGLGFRVILRGMLDLRINAQIARAKLPLLPVPPPVGEGDDPSLIREDDDPSFLWYLNQARPTRVEARFETNETPDSPCHVICVPRVSSIVKSYDAYLAMLRRPWLCT